MSQNAPQYARTIEAKVQGVQAFAVAKLASMTKQLGAVRAAAQADERIGRPDDDRDGRPAPPVPVEMVGGDTSPLSIAKTVLAPILGPLETTILVLIVAIFVLMQKEDLRDRFIRVFGSSDLHRTTRAMDDAGAAAEPIFPVAAGGEHQFRHRHRAGPVG